jgi:hypothetical protein
LGRDPTSRSDDSTLPEPPRGFRLGFSLAKGQVVITRYRKIIPALGATTFRDPSCDSDPAGPVQESVWHGCLQSLDWSAWANRQASTGRECVVPGDVILSCCFQYVVGYFVSEEAFFVQGAKKRHHVASPLVE